MAVILLSLAHFGALVAADENTIVFVRGDVKGFCAGVGSVSHRTHPDRDRLRDARMTLDGCNAIKAWISSRSRLTTRPARREVCT